MGNTLANGQYKVFPLASEDLSPPPPPYSNSSNTQTGYSGYDDDSLVVDTSGMNPGDQVYNYEQNDEVLEQLIGDAMNGTGFFDDKNKDSMDGLDLGKLMKN